MPIPTTRYKDIDFYSGFTYFRQVASGFVDSHFDGFGSSVIDGTTATIPAEVIQRPPYIDFYLEYPIGTFRSLGGEGNLQVGYNSDTIFFDGFLSDPTFVAPFRVHYFIYDRSIQ